MTFLDVLSSLPERGNRMSSLSVAEFCGLSPQLARAHGAGRAAAMGSHFHALCAGAQQTTALTPDEAAKVAAWIKPTTTTLSDGTVLEYKDAEKELELYLAPDGTAAECAADALAVGHLDFAWCHLHIEQGLRICYVADIKKTAFTVTGPDSLQLVAYGHSYCERKKADGYVCGIYVAETGEWIWEKEVTMVGTERYAARRDRVLFAARNIEPTGSRGGHCEQCWSRLSCREWLLPAAMGDTFFRSVCEGGELTPQVAGELKLRLKALEDLAEAANKQLGAYVDRGGKIVGPNGETLQRKTMPGRESISVARAREVFGADADKAITRGKPYQQFGSWTRAK
jgi:hypothetical protein